MTNLRTDLNETQALDTGGFRKEANETEEADYVQNVTDENNQKYLESDLNLTGDQEATTENNIAANSGRSVLSVDNLQDGEAIDLEQNVISQEIDVGEFTRNLTRNDYLYKTDAVHPGETNIAGVFSNESAVSLQPKPMLAYSREYNPRNQKLLKGKSQEIRVKKNKNHRSVGNGFVKVKNATAFIDKYLDHTRPNYLKSKAEMMSSGYGDQTAITNANSNTHSAKFIGEDFKMNHFNKRGSSLASVANTVSKNSPMS
jgi:hypothetical protein